MARRLAAAWCGVAHLFEFPGVRGDPGGLVLGLDREPDARVERLEQLGFDPSRGDERWSTIGASQNIIEASYQALWDSLELPLLRSRDGELMAAGSPEVRADAAGS